MMLITISLLLVGVDKTFFKYLLITLCVDIILIRLTTNVFDKWNSYIAAYSWFSRDKYSLCHNK